MTLYQGIDNIISIPFQGLTRMFKELLRKLFKIEETGHPEIKRQPIPKVGKQKRRAKGTANTEYQVRKWKER